MDERRGHWGSHEFQEAVKEAGYILEQMASDASFQNVLSEWPNCTLADMMYSLLHSANLGPQYWSWVSQHAVYFKNQLPHRIAKTMLYQTYMGVKPNIKKLQVFGCPIIVRLPGKHPAKLDTHAAM
jgi:hypothetical protein